LYEKEQIAVGGPGLTVYAVTDLALDLRLFGLVEAVDSEWCAEVKHYTVSKIRVHIPRIGEDHGRD